MPSAAPTVLSTPGRARGWVWTCTWMSHGLCSAEETWPTCPGPTCTPSSPGAVVVGSTCPEHLSLYTCRGLLPCLWLPAALGQLAGHLHGILEGPTRDNPWIMRQRSHWIDTQVPCSPERKFRGFHSSCPGGCRPKARDLTVQFKNILLPLSSVSHTI